MKRLSSIQFHPFFFVCFFEISLVSSNVILSDSPNNNLQRKLRTAIRMSVIYHLTPASRWNSWPKDQLYFPSAYDVDGFIHCTAGDELMIDVAIRFCRSIPGDFVLLFVDIDKLDPTASPVKWEKATDIDALFPHIYGGINHEAVVNVQQMQRSKDGTFLGWAKSSNSSQ